jgi:hypothetical protein
VFHVKRRLLLAVLLAPLVTVPAMLTAVFVREPRLVHEADAWRVVTLSYLPWAYAAAIVVGLPLHLWLRRSNRRWPWYAVTGMTVAVIAGAIVGTLVGGTPNVSDWIAVAAAGFLGGLLFRDIAGPARGGRLERS